MARRYKLVMYHCQSNHVYFCVRRAVDTLRVCINEGGLRLVSRTTLIAWCIP